MGILKINLMAATLGGWLALAHTASAQPNPWNEQLRYAPPGGTVLVYDFDILLDLGPSKTTMKGETRYVAHF